MRISPSRARANRHRPGAGILERQHGAPRRLESPDALRHLSEAVAPRRARSLLDSSRKEAARLPLRPSPTQRACAAARPSSVSPVKPAECPAIIDTVTARRTGNQPPKATYDRSRARRSTARSRDRARGRRQELRLRAGPRRRQPRRARGRDHRAARPVRGGKDGHDQAHRRAHPALGRGRGGRRQGPRRADGGRALRASPRDERRAPGHPAVHLRPLLLAERVRERRLRAARPDSPGRPSRSTR